MKKTSDLDNDGFRSIYLAAYSDGGQGAGFHEERKYYNITEASARRVARLISSLMDREDFYSMVYTYRRYTIGRYIVMKVECYTLHGKIKKDK